MSMESNWKSKPRSLILFDKVNRYDNCHVLLGRFPTSFKFSWILYLQIDGVGVGIGGCGSV